MTFSMDQTSEFFPRPSSVALLSFTPGAFGGIQTEGRGMAIAGIVTGAVWAVLFGVLIGLLIAFAGNAGQ